jgi:crotonobetainyl-CoA:carnitine CoA-transferase CaiB-like acyl-CoA transferase
MAAAPLTGLKVVVRAAGVAAAYAGRLLGNMGGNITLLEAEGGSPLRREPPFFPGTQVSASFAYLAVGMSTAEAANPARHLAGADIFIDDTPVTHRAALGIDPEAVAAAHPDLIHVSVLPFGAVGQKAHWLGEEINLQHASGEGYLLPNGLSVEQFPERPPVKIGGHFAEMQGGLAAVMGALSALRARPSVGGQFVDISCQDAMLAVGAFAIQRLGDGSIEHRVERSFRYGGVIACADGYVELLTLEQRQWDGLVDLLGRPDWALDPALEDSLERSRRGVEINRHIREWAISRKIDDVVREGQKRSVPIARYMTPADILADAHQQERGFFVQTEIAGVGTLPMATAPFQFDGQPLPLGAVL